MFSIDIEFPLVSALPIQYIYYHYLANLTAEEADKQEKKMKDKGLGGRLSRWDGTPDGLIVRTWGSLQRVLNAQLVEKQALLR